MKKLQRNSKFFKNLKWKNLYIFGISRIEDSIHKYFSNQNPSDLNRSIKSLLISEHLVDHEKVKESKGLFFEAEVQKLVTTFPENAKIKLICYTGHTKPSKEEKG